MPAEVPAQGLEEGDDVGPVEAALAGRAPAGALEHPLVDVGGDQGAPAPHGLDHVADTADLLDGLVERLISTMVLGFAANEATGRFAHHPPDVVEADWQALQEIVLGVINRR